MANRVWIPVLAAVALLLSACGDSQEDSNVTPDDNSEVTEDETVREAEAPAVAENAAEMSSPEEGEDEIEARQTAEELERADALREDEAKTLAPMAAPRVPRWRPGKIRWQLTLTMRSMKTAPCPERQHVLM